MNTKIHFAGELTIPGRGNLITKIYPGWAACCSGPEARKIRESGNVTYVPDEVTCKRCRAQIDRARA